MHSLEERQAQLVNLETLAESNQQKTDSGVTEVESPPSLQYFQSQIFNKFSPPDALSTNQAVWIVYDSSRLTTMEVPQVLADKMLVSTRIHVDTNLDDRVQYILKSYEYIC